MKINDIQVKHKIIVSLALPLIMFVLFAVWTRTVGTDVSSTIEIIEKDKVEHALLAERMKRNVVQIQQWLTDISATRGLDGLNDGFDEAAKNYLFVVDGLERFKTKYQSENKSEGLTRVKELRQRVDDYYSIGKKMARAYIEGGPEMGNKIMAEFDTAAAALTEVLEPFVAEQVEGIGVSLNGINAIVNKLKLWITLVSLLVILGGIASVTFLMNSINGPLSKSINIANKLANGELDMKIEEAGKDEFGQMLYAQHSMLNNLLDMVGKIKGVSSALSTDCSALLASTSKISEGIEDQTQQVERTAAAATELSQTILEVARNAGDAANTVSASVNIANDGKSVVEKTVQSMMNIAKKVQESSDTIGSLGESSKQIGDIINVINDIAGQTNLLALNAAIEAARAGEQGRGFAVVADEVRKLAESTGKATDQITNMIKKIQTESVESVRVMEDSKKEAEGGVDLVGKANESLTEIVEAAGISLQTVQAIATASTEQSAAIDEVSANIEHISEVFGTSRDSIVNINDLTYKLAEIADELMSLISWFKMADEKGMRIAGTQTSDSTRKSTLLS
ncbi:MAG: methyl-accepting chemotaxis protein [Nitrospira sp.]|nr:methyl-accepting chemotaxis protein [bacterium]MBL7049628.1 methyl-accepting chemotaxis protein [Nitrospira sp.]